MTKEQETEALMELMLLEQLQKCSQALSTLAVHGMVTLEEMQMIGGKIRKQLHSITNKGC